MRDIGPTRGRVRSLADRVQRDFLSGWLMDNQENFIEAMEAVREGSPLKYAKLYLEAAKIGMTKEQNININLVDRERDRERLQALVKTRVSTALPNYTPYEEIKPKTVTDEHLIELERERIALEQKEKEEGQ